MWVVHYATLEAVPMVAVGRGLKTALTAVALGTCVWIAVKLVAIEMMRSRISS